MVKYIILLGLLLTQTSCSLRKNNYNSVRVPISKFSIKPNNDSRVYDMIDTTSIYMNVEINGCEKIMDGKGGFKTVKSMNNGIKFYGNGRVARFQNVNFQNVETLNPQKAGMGIYELTKEGIVAQFVSQSKQAGVFIIQKKVTIKNETLTLKDESYVYKYVKKHFDRKLIYRPDW